MNNVAEIVKRCLSYGDEAEWFDFKDSVFKPDEIGEYISALSNAAAMEREPFGYLIWGIDNDTHEYTNTRFNYQKDVNHEPFQHYLSRYVSPTIPFHFDEDLIDGNRVVILTIPSARIVPSEYKEIRYIRIGSSKEKLKRFPDRETELFKILIEKENPTDDWESRISRFRISDIDMNVFKEYLQKAGSAGRITFKSRDPKAVLNKLELTDDEYLLNAGAALFVDSGINELQMAKFATDERITFNDIKRFTGSIFDLVDKAVQYIADSMDWRVEFDGSLERKEYPEIPVDAVREAVINAFGHRLIESRQAVEVAIYKSYVDIYSPGIFPEGVEPEQFINEERRPLRRNPLIARTLYYSKDMESFATGLRRIYDACTSADVRFEFKREPYGFTVRFYRHSGKGWNKNQVVSGKQPEKQPKTKKSLEIEERAKVILEMIRNNPHISRGEIADNLSISEMQARTAIELLKNRKIVHHEGAANGGYWVVDK